MRKNYTKDIFEREALSIVKLIEERAPSYRQTLEHIYKNFEQ